MVSRGQGCMLLGVVLCSLLLAQYARAFCPPLPKTSSSRRPVSWRVYSVSEDKGPSFPSSSSSSAPLGGASNTPRVPPVSRTKEEIFAELERANNPTAQYLGNLADSLQVDVEKITPKAPKITQEDVANFKFPAYGFLGISIISAILAIGSVSELTGGHPLLGQAPTIGLIAGCAPASVFCFIQALKRGEEERIADDKAFLGENNYDDYDSDEEGDN